MPELEQKTFQKRHVAYKVRISDILNSDFIKDDFSGYVKLNDVNVSRVNIIATLVYKSEGLGYNSALIDDGSGKISLRAFENNIFSKIDVGDIVLVIGRLREFNNERYIISEIIKKINNIQWLNFRKIELNKNFPETEAKNNVKSKIDGSIEEVNDINDAIYLLIKKLDDGHGVSVEDIINNSSNKEAEKIVKRLLEKGDIFEVKPGILKVLE